MIVAGGGTGGHVYPGVAVAREVLRRDPESEVLFMGAEKGVEAKVIPMEGFRIETLDISGLKDKGVMGKIVSLGRLAGAVKKSLGVIKSFGPDVVLGVGGYASGPALIAALISGRPVALAEQNIRPGMTNRWMKRLARKAFVTWPSSEKYFPVGVASLTGNPIRPEFFTAKRKREDGRLWILVTGGSQGARSVNRAMAESVEALNEFADSVFVCHQTGLSGLDETKKAYAGAKFPWVVDAFFHDMPQRLADSDLVIARAGAGTIAEICAVGRAAVYVPYPYAADDHQTKNAEAMADAGAAVLIKDDELNGERIAEVVRKYLNDRRMLEDMGAKAKKMAKPAAASDIADELFRIAGERKAA